MLRQQYIARCISKHSAVDIKARAKKTIAQHKAFKQRMEIDNDAALRRIRAKVVDIHILRLLYNAKAERERLATLDTIEQREDELVMAERAKKRKMRALEIKSTPLLAAPASVPAIPAFDDDDEDEEGKGEWLELTEEDDRRRDNVDFLD